MSVNNTPDIFPVNYHAANGKVTLRTGEGDQTLRTGGEQPGGVRVRRPHRHRWLECGGQGHGTDPVLAERDRAADQLPLRPWIATVKYNYVEIVVDEITARRFEFGPEPERYPPV